MKTSLVMVLCAGILLATSEVGAKPISHEPQLRVEVGSHTAMIRQLSVDQVAGTIVTASDDKTLRIWSIDKRRLLRTIRVPIAEGFEGRLYAVASQNGLIAVGGWTGLEWEGRSVVYLISTDTGEVLRRIKDLPGSVSYLKFGDKNRLAIGVANANSGTLVLADFGSGNNDIAASEWLGIDLGAKVRGIDFHPSHGYAVTTVDGQIWLSDKNLKWRQAKVPGGDRPFRVKFSPDGQHLAIGFIDTPQVAWLRTKDLGLENLSETNHAVSLKNLPGVAWSRDGKTVYAIGDTEGDVAKIQRWDNKGMVIPPFEFKAERLTAIETLADGRVIIATEDPYLIVLNSDGDIEFRLSPQLVLFQQAGPTLRLSPKGETVAFEHDGSYVEFSIPNQRLISVTNPDPRLLPTKHSHSGLEVTNWKDVQIVNAAPAINGVSLPLEDGDISRAIALTHDGQYVVLGTDWGMYLFNRSGRTVWKRQAPDIVWGLNVSVAGNVFIAAHADGSIRWYRLDDGEEFLAAYVHPDKEDWIAWNPAGYYTSSPNGDQYIGWHINRAVDQTADFYRAVQFERVLFRPDIVKDSFVSMGRSRIEAPDLAAIAPPRVEFAALRTRSKGSVEQGQAIFQIAVDKNSLPMQDYGIYVNNIPVTPSVDRLLQGSDRDRFNREIVVNLHETDNVVRVEVFNGKSMGLLEQYVEGPEQALDPPRGDLYLYAAGAGRFDNDIRCADPERQSAAWRWRSLVYAPADAVAIKNQFVAMEGTTFEKVHWRILSDDEGLPPTRANLISELEFIKQAGPNDTAIIFLASHGLSNAKGNYYFVPRDGSIEDGCRLTDNRDDIETLISWETFFDALRVTAGRRLMMVDTCHSGDMSIDTKFDAFSLTKRSTASSFALMSAATGTQDSQPYPDGGHGLFTFSVLDSLRKGVDADQDGWTSLREVFDYSGPFVQRNRPKPNLEQTPVLVDPEPLGSMRLGWAGRDVSSFSGANTSAVSANP